MLTEQTVLYIIIFISESIEPLEGPSRGLYRDCDFLANLRLNLHWLKSVQVRWLETALSSCGDISTIWRSVARPVPVQEVEHVCMEEREPHFFGCESSPISLNVRSLVSQLVS